MKHRRPKMPESMERFQPMGMCRWCDKPILKPDGTPNGRRNWHPECVEIYRVACFSGDQRSAVYKRDGGKCARCGRVGFDWQADHIKPLIESNGDLSYFLLENLQTLCTPCHVEKGNEDRARRKGIATRQQGLALT